MALRVPWGDDSLVHADSPGRLRCLPVIDAMVERNRKGSHKSSGRLDDGELTINDDRRRWAGNVAAEKCKNDRSAAGEFSKLNQPAVPGSTGGFLQNGRTGA